MKRLILSLLILASTFIAKSQSLILKATTESLILTTSSTADIDFQVNYADLVLATGGTPGTQEGKITTATSTDIVSAPAASTYRLIKSISIKNINTTTSNTITIVKDISATTYELFETQLGPNEQLNYTEEKGWELRDRNGKLKVTDPTISITGLSKFLMKSYTAADAAGYWYCGSKDAGIPGAWAPGTPGLAGRATNGLSSNDVGCINFPDAGSGLSRYLTNVTTSSTALQSFMYMDVLWVNSGLVVTTTTAQTINSVALPARDDDGTTNGKGCQIGLLAVAALGNAAVISNSTVTYTNEDGTGSRAATLSAVVGYQFPATPVIGTVVWFKLQDGDEGVQSIQSITLNTTLTSGTASLIIARPLAFAPVSVVNQGFPYYINNGDGVKLYDRACILPFFQAQNAGTTVMSGTLTTLER